MSSADSAEIPAVRALVPAPDGLRLRLAPSLEAARPGEFVHIDDGGRVRSPLRYRILQAVPYATIGGITAYYFAILGAGAAVGIGATLGLWFGYWLRRRHRLSRAAILLEADHLNEARDLLERELSRALQPREYRTLARYNMASCMARQGEREGALAQIEPLVAEPRPRRRRLRLLRAMTDHLHVLLLAGLGRVKEARSALEQMAPIGPQADYLEYQRWTSELSVYFAEGSCSLDDEELHTRARRALAITNASILLGLLAWAYKARGDQEQATLLLGEALDRLTQPSRLEVLPALRDWLQAQPRPAE